MTTQQRKERKKNDKKSAKNEKKEKKMGWNRIEENKKGYNFQHLQPCERTMTMKQVAAVELEDR